MSAMRAFRMRTIVGFSVCLLAALPCDGQEDGKAPIRRALLIQPPGAVWAPAGLGVGPVVAFNPVVKYAPTGATVGGSGHVSHDRRYVTLNMGASNAELIDVRRINVGPIAPGAAGPQAGPMVAAPPPGLALRFAVAANRAALHATQRESVQKVLQDQTVAETAWDLANGLHLSQLARKIAEAPPAGKSAVRNELSAAQAERQEITAEYDAKTMAAMTPAQRIKWHGSLLGRSLLEAFASVDLTPEQRGSIREFADKTAGDCIAGGDDTPAPSVRVACVEQIARDVLTADQKAKYAEPADAE
jgi:hypothetical protein